MEINQKIKERNTNVDSKNNTGTFKDCNNE